MNNILYVVINKELKMSAGKAASQAVHAAMLLPNNDFTENYKRTVIVLEAENAEQIKNLEEYLDNAGIFSAHYVDEGHNEVEAYSLTALAVEPFSEDDEEKREIFESFRLFSGDYEMSSRKTDKQHALEYLEIINHWSEVPRFAKKTMKWLRNK